MDINLFRKHLARQQNLQEGAATAAHSLDQNLKKFIELGHQVVKDLEQLEATTEPGDIKGLWSGPPRNVTFEHFISELENWHRKLSPELKRVK